MKSWAKSFTISILAVLMLATGMAVIAQKGTSVVKRIKFARGRTTAVEKGSVRRGVSHDYLLKASAGQTMTVHLAARGGVNFSIFSPGFKEMLADGAKDWSGELPRSGDYRINVLPDTTHERSIPYTLEVTVR
jgi:hypothetical protein